MLFILLLYFGILGYRFWLIGKLNVIFDGLKINKYLMFVLENYYI